VSQFWGFQKWDTCLLDVNKEDGMQANAEMSVYSYMPILNHQNAM